VVGAGDIEKRLCAIDVTIHLGKECLLIDAATKIPQALQAIEIHAHETFYTRILATEDPANLADNARPRKLSLSMEF
jgi:hypothetical protein